MINVYGEQFVSVTNTKQYIRQINGKWHAFGIGVNRDNTVSICLRIRRERVIEKSRQMALVMGWSK